MNDFDAVFTENVPLYLFVYKSFEAILDSHIITFKRTELVLVQLINYVLHVPLNMGLVYFQVICSSVVLTCFLYIKN